MFGTEGQMDGLSGGELFVMVDPYRDLVLTDPDPAFQEAAEIDRVDDLAREQVFGPRTLGPSGMQRHVLGP